jgi:hypothetical protein
LHIFLGFAKKNHAAFQAAKNVTPSKQFWLHRPPIFF